MLSQESAGQNPPYQDPEKSSLASQQQLSLATQALVECSNRALQQSSQKLSLLEAELSDLRSRLESVSNDLASERQQRIAAEAQLEAQMVAVRKAAPATVPLSELEATLARPADLLRQASERQLELVKSMESVMHSRQPVQSAPAQPLPNPFQSLALWLSPLGGGVIGGSVVLLGLRMFASNPSLTGPGSPTIAGTEDMPTAQPQTRYASEAASTSNGTLYLRCDQPCWLDVHELPGNKPLVAKNLKGNLSLPIGTGLDVFTGRGDLLKVRINDGPETQFSTRMVGKREFLPPSP